MWMDRDGYLGLSSSTRSCLIHSWSFELRQVPHWIHSQPLDPTVSKEEEANALIAASDEKSDCFLKVLAALILGVAGGSLGTFCLLYHWTICGRRRPVAPVEFPGKEKSVDCEYKKVEVAVPLTVNFNILKGKTIVAVWFENSAFIPVSCSGVDCFLLPRCVSHIASESRAECYMNCFCLLPLEILVS
ncbi:hypothetical protein SAY87_028084 [Trapa incisa]|uniref:Uncharacterized protein n=1 Tax=Trapa incisa TaxID=236973 RepID=A0AAN7L078_9MYRT|nr:hypothetical protein SAY87_028084 [Trapa incisa]